MSQASLRDPFANGSMAEGKLRQFEKGFCDLKNEVILTDKQISKKQATKLKDIVNQLRNIKYRTETMRFQCISKNAKLKNEIGLLEKKLKGFQIGAKILETEARFKAKIAQQQKVFVENCQKRIQIAESIDYKKIRKIQIEERKSLANEVFKWMLVAIYLQPQNKYYWPNFKEQVILNKKGCEDLKERLGKFDAFHAREDQRAKTIKFVQMFDKIKVCSELSEFSSEIQKIYQIAKLFLSLSDIGRKVRECEKEIQECRKQYFKQDEALSQGRKECDALNEKYRLCELYLERLTRIEDSVTTKLLKYHHQGELAESYISQISNITASKITFTEPKDKLETREHCQCSIF